MWNHLYIADAPNTVILSHIFCRTNKIMVSKSMNDISSLRDYYIADAINDIQSMSRDELERKLINIETEKIEHLTDDEILRFKQNNHDS